MLSIPAKMIQGGSLRVKTIRTYPVTSVVQAAINKSLLKEKLIECQKRKKWFHYVLVCANVRK